MITKNIWIEEISKVFVFFDDRIVALYSFQ